MSQLVARIITNRNLRAQFCFEDQMLIAERLAAAALAHEVEEEDVELADFALGNGGKVRRLCESRKRVLTPDHMLYPHERRGVSRV